MGTIKNGYKWLGAKIGGNSVNGIAKGGNIIYKKIDPTLILDCDFNNNFTNKVLGGVQLIAGNVNGLPTFTLEGGEYAATFNGSQSLKTNSNFVLGTDKVSISFWMKTSQTVVSIITELSTNSNNFNSFYGAINNAIPNRVDVYDNISSSSNNLGSSSVNINDNIWHHIILMIDRNQPALNQNKIYVDGVLSYIQHTSRKSDTSGDFGILPLFVGQRAGNSLGFNGQMKNLKIWNRIITQSEIDNL